MKDVTMMRQPTNTRNSIASNTQHQPLVGKDSAGVTKTLAELERRQLHPLVLRKRGLERRWSTLWLKGDGGIRKETLFGKRDRVIRKNNNKRIAKNTLLLYFRMLFMMVVSLYTSRVILNALGVEDFGIYNVVGGVVTIQLLLSLIIVVLQFSIVTFVIGLISVPYNAAIIAHEKMSAFAYISILEAVGKLAIAFLIMASPIDRLIFYAILMCVVGLIIRFTYGHYCKKHFAEVNNEEYVASLLPNVLGNGRVAVYEPSYIEHLTN